jgi:enoyl-CoA hydratase/carnithine racemase
MAGMPSVRVEHEGTVAVVTLSQPPANAMDAASLNELADVFDRLAVDDDVTAIVLTGDGRAFSAGLDLKAIQDSGPGHQEELIEALNRAFLAVYSCPRLVIAAVNGHAIAGGLVLALCCDVRLVADVALKVGLAEVRVGVPYPVGAIEVVRHELDGSVARRLVLSGELIGAHDAVSLGVFDRLVPADDLLAAALAAARDHPPQLGFARIKAQLRHPAIDATRAALGGRDPLARPWLTDETFAAAAAALRRP